MEEDHVILQQVRNELRLYKMKLAEDCVFKDAIKKVKYLLLSEKKYNNFFQEVCAVLNDLEFVKAVCMGSIEKDSFEVQLLAQTGIEDRVRADIKITWDNSKYGKGPTGAAIKTQQVQIVNNIETESVYDIWRAVVRKNSFSSSMCVPLIHAGEVMGVLNIYSEEKNTFNDERVDFFTEVGKDIALGIKNIIVEREVIKAKDAIVQANSLKRQFVTNISHEIRNPMNGIIGITDLTLMTELTEEQRENLNFVKMSAKALLKTITDVLDYSRIEAGKFELEDVTFHFQETIDEVIQSFEQVAQDKGLDLCIQYDKMIHERVIGDSASIGQVLSNMIDNALKFTHEGRIVVEIVQEELDDSNVLLKFGIHDTGIGIPQEKVDTIFTSFSQADSSYTKGYGGIGLGLAIAKKMAELMGGEIWFESQEGIGSQFYFTAKVRTLVL